ncbi:hypothetical protein LIER_18716 [Lithospermum erythrorhizon]|uniref:RING-type domain-containing protein n=1 Tax=Lithospermum erythrorhizon TaxID=34254 RepID=A0AAV3QJF1_LITER
MGLSNFPSPAGGVLPVLVMNTVLSVTLFKNMVSSLLHVVSASPEENSSNLDEDYTSLESNEAPPPRRRRISTTRYQTLCKTRYDEDQEGGSKFGKNEDGGNSNKWSLMDCCVCLNRFEGDEEVSELSCKHFFHKACLEKWFDNQHTSCPLCRSIL